MSRKRGAKVDETTKEDRRVRRHLREVVRHGATAQDIEDDRQDWQEPLPIKKKEKREA